jgi:hypothetical protein
MQFAIPESCNRDLHFTFGTNRRADGQVRRAERDPTSPDYMAAPKRWRPAAPERDIMKGRRVTPFRQRPSMDMRAHTTTVLGSATIRGRFIGVAYTEMKNVLARTWSDRPSTTRRSEW